MTQRWTSLLSSLHRALLDVLRAELETLIGDLSNSGRRLGVALALLAVAAGFGLVFLGVLVLAAIAALALVLPLWGAALVVAAALGLVAVVAAWLGLRRLQALENPADTVRRRVDNHVTWWRTRLAAEPELTDEIEE